MAAFLANESPRRRPLFPQFDEIMDTNRRLVDEARAMNGIFTPCSYMYERGIRSNTITTDGPETLRYYDDMRTHADIPRLAGHLDLALRRAYEFDHRELIPEIEARLAAAPVRSVDRTIVLIGGCEHAELVNFVLARFPASAMLEFAKFLGDHGSYGFLPRWISQPFVEFVAAHLPSTGHHHFHDYTKLHLSSCGLINFSLLERAVLPEQRHAYLAYADQHRRTKWTLGMPVAIHAARTRHAIDDDDEQAPLTPFRVRSYNNVAPESTHRLGDISIAITTMLVEIVGTMRITKPLITVTTGSSIVIIRPGEWADVVSENPQCVIKYPSLHGTDCRIILPNSTVTTHHQGMKVFDTGLPASALPHLIAYATPPCLWQLPNQDGDSDDD